ncbi:unnamed protein product [Protopolystoma xenopodis]|uniref:MAM domain-containing protein n=1 Tax=Protopolystoma xenopodis TaxID=117903 RepID=A0A3S5CL52_9PLAT|nr:unnamed protein product [Protopolystoma xenopodis]
MFVITERVFVCTFLYVCVRTRTYPLKVGHLRKHYCSFAEGWCGWVNDQSNWQHRWSLLNDSSNNNPTKEESFRACFLAHQPEHRNDATNGFTWFNEEVKPGDGATRGWSNAIGVTQTHGPLISRLWSPLIPSKIGFKCIHFFYQIRLGLRDRSDRNSAGVVFCSPPRPDFDKLSCRFSSFASRQTDCAWIADQNDWSDVHWNLIQLPSVDRSLFRPEDNKAPIMALCLQAPKQALETGESISARLWSPSIQLSGQDQRRPTCLTLNYRLFLGRQSVSPMPTLSILKRQKGLVHKDVVDHYRIFLALLLDTCRLAKPRFFL